VRVSVFEFCENGLQTLDVKDNSGNRMLEEAWLVQAAEQGGRLPAAMRVRGELE
jgi:hypothetical protein